MRKLRLLIGVLASSLLLTGGAIAAFTVVDNAGEKIIPITPGTISTEEQTGTVTLSYGDEVNFTKFEGLQVGTPAVGMVEVKATTADDDEAVYKGKLHIAFEDTSGKTATERKLLDYLKLEVEGRAYNGQAFADQDSLLGTLDGATESEKDLDVYADKDGNLLTFTVTLDPEAAPYMGVIKTDIVHLKVNWNAGELDDAVKTVYIPANGWETMYLFSYNSQTGVANNEWPGVELNKNADGLFVAPLILTHDRFILTEAADSVEHRYPADGEQGMALDTDMNDNIYFDWSTHELVATAPELVEEGYYLVGTLTGWGMKAEYKFDLYEEQKEDHDQYVLHDVVLEEGDEFKIRHSSSWDGAFPADNFVVTAALAGTYDFYMVPDAFIGEWNGHFYMAKHNEQQDPVDPVATPDYRIVGTMNDWTYDDSELHLAADESKEGYTFALMGVEFAADAKFKVVDENNIWYPDGMGNDYVIELAGTYNVYFNPTNSAILAEAAQ